MTAETASRSPALENFRIYLDHAYETPPVAGSLQYEELLQAWYGSAHWVVCAVVNRSDEAAMVLLHDLVSETAAFVADRSEGRR